MVARFTSLLCLAMLGGSTSTEPGDPVADALIKHLSKAWRRGLSLDVPFRLRAAPTGQRPWRYEIPQPERVVCGVGWGVADPEPLRRAATSLCRAYGLAAAPGYYPPRDIGERSGFTLLGTSARFDALDVDRQVAVVLVDDWVKQIQDPSFPENDARALHLSPDEHLSVTEYVEMLEAGYRLHVASLTEYAYFDETPFLSMLAYFASLSAFLDSVTDTHHVALDGLISGEWFQHVAGEAAVACEHGSVVADGERFSLRVDRACVVTIAFLPGDAWQCESHPTETPSTSGRITLVHYAVLSNDGHDVTEMTIRQAAADGTSYAAQGATEMLVPPWFDVTRPYDVELSLPPGKYGLDRAITLRATR